MGLNDTTDPLDFEKINAPPAPLPLIPPQERTPPKPAVKEGQRAVEGQLLSAIFAWDMRDRLISAQRDLFSEVNRNRFELKGILAVTPTSDEVAQEFQASQEVRADLGLDPIDESLYTQLRPPGIAPTVIADFIQAMGYEQTFSDDVETL
jgi:hypothetical protein